MKAVADGVKVQSENTTVAPGANGKFVGPHTAWKPGQSGNPNGRPKQEPLLTPELRRQLNQVCPEDPQKRIWLVVLAERTMKLAAKGNNQALKELWERVDGKVKDTIQLDVRIAAIRQMTDAELERFVQDAAQQTIAERVSA